MNNEKNIAAHGTWSIHHDRAFELRKEHTPALLLGGQVFNSSSSSPQSIADSFAHARRMNGNAVLAPVSWALLEPVEGTFDFTLVDRMLEEATGNDLRLVILWFGAFKNAGSTYAPRWVRADRDRFPRAVIEAKGLQAFTYEGAMAKPVLSVFSESLREADAVAFEALLRHIAEADAHGTVAMIQVENESGILSDSRDRGPLAEQAWSAQVPDALLAHVGDDRGEGSLARDLWQESGSRSSGTWPEVFGTDSRADEVFMAWAFASYVEHLCVRARAVTPLPTYANAWLGPQPGQEEAGQYPSGGPASRVLDVWHVAAPTLALLAPDIYVDDAENAMRVYGDGHQPFFVPESRPSAPELVRAVGSYRAIGWSAFGIDGANPQGQVAATLAYLTALEAPITIARVADRLGSVVIEPGQERADCRIDGIDIVARDTLSLVHRMLLDAGVRAPEPEVSLPDETLADSAMPHPADPRPFGMLIAEEQDVFIVVGRGLMLDFFCTDACVEIDSVEELLVEDRRIVSGRVLGGDERLRVLPTDRVGAARIRLIRV